VLSWLGEDSAAVGAFRRALELDPARAVTLLDLAEVLIVARDDALARTLLDSAIAVDPAQARPYLTRANVRLRAGDVSGARTDGETGLRLSSPGLRDFALAVLVAVDAAAGDTTRARARLAGVSSTSWGGADVARALLAVGGTDAAIAALERATAVPGRWYLLRFPEYDRLRAHPRFARLMAAARP
jgi:predicted Zn-dependent protease